MNENQQPDSNSKPKRRVPLVPAILAGSALFVVGGLAGGAVGASAVMVAGDSSTSQGPGGQNGPGRMGGGQNGASPTAAECPADKRTAGKRTVRKRTVVKRTAMGRREVSRTVCRIRRTEATGTSDHAVRTERGGSDMTMPPSKSMGASSAISAVPRRRGSTEVSPR
ncbi:hypothetical protein [Brevibacterium epidermidis]|uniref:hypothetical protein n=1 Tax=Brevibacterium epidermidis TaxID=1698 RepID=UPI000BF4F608|nr:hypothetical protein [Brevibacterium epidermidis]